MAEEPVPNNQADAPVTPVATKKLTLAVDLPTADDVLICEVCGHENPPRSPMCAMCSNYLD